jgi:predicted nucleic acid-binding protein
VNAFFDTNVLLDVLLQRSEFYEHSARVWALAETGSIRGLAAAVSFTNVFYIVERLRGRDTARDTVRGILEAFTPAACDEAVVRQAARADLDDFEDAVQYFSALHAGADCILTRNVADFPRRPALPVLTPREFLARSELS